jgi:23S rRNA (cytosine1962-C5)-methyltransferase
VILSGGDPLLLDDDRLADLLGRIVAIPTVTRIRIHTRLPVVLPSRVTPRLVALLAGLPAPAVVVIHANHPAELGPDQAAAVRDLASSRAILLNQAVLLTGVNDTLPVLLGLSERLLAVGVLPYYLHLPDRVIRGTAPDGPVFIREGNLSWGVDLTEGQKTGFYLDQRENRRAAALLARDRRVLDLFCYSGGFAVTCAVTGAARSVLAVDGSAKATALARANADFNGAANVTVETADAFVRIDSLSAAGEKFGMVILDPPKFARSRGAIDEALRAYHRINRVAVDLLEPGGILVTCSCSGSVSRDDFLEMLSAVAQRSGRQIAMLECRGAAPDHPVSASCLEGEYLKCIIARVA